VHTHPGTRHLQRHRHPERPPRLDVHQRLGQRILPVEVSGQPPAPVAVQQRINADVHIALQMSSQHILGQRQVVPPLMRNPALPPAAHRREPAPPARTGVLDPGGADVGARREQRPEERHLRVIGRVFMNWSRRRIEEAGLRRTGRRGLPRAQLQHLQQARILRPQTRQLHGHSRGNLSHAHTMRNLQPRSSCRSGKRQPGPRTEFSPAAARSPTCLTRPLGVTRETTTPPRRHGRRADRGTWPCPMRRCEAAGHRLTAATRQDCQSVRIYASDQRPRQDSNLRSRLRRGLLCMPLTCEKVLQHRRSGHASDTARQAETTGAQTERCR